MSEAVNEDLRLDIDIRLSPVWAEVRDIDCWDEEIVGEYLRAAYGRGYVDCLHEVDNGQGAKLHRDHGFPDPRKTHG